MAAFQYFTPTLILAGLTIGLFANDAPAQDAPEAADAIKAADGPQFLRIEEERGKWVALEIASREYQLENGPRVALVGVAHIADRSFYRSVQRLLAECHDFANLEVDREDVFAVLVVECQQQIAPSDIPFRRQSVRQTLSCKFAGQTVSTRYPTR